MIPRRHDYHGPADVELAMWPDVTARREYRTKHLALVLTFAGASRFVTYPLSPSDVRGAFRHVHDIRNALNILGALRNAPRGVSHTRQLEAA